MTIVSKVPIIYRFLNIIYRFYRQVENDLYKFHISSIIIAKFGKTLDLQIKNVMVLLYLQPCSFYKAMRQLSCTSIAQTFFKELH